MTGDLILARFANHSCSGSSNCVASLLKAPMVHKAVSPPLQSSPCGCPPHRPFDRKIHVRTRQNVAPSAQQSTKVSSNRRSEHISTDRSTNRNLHLSMYDAERVSKGSTDKQDTLPGARDLSKRCRNPSTMMVVQLFACAIMYIIIIGKGENVLPVP